MLTPMNAGSFQLFVIIAVAVLSVLFVAILILLIINMVNIRKMKRNYRVFMNGKTAENLEDSILDHFKKIDELQVQADAQKAQIEDINEQLLSAFNKRGIVKYDAFNEMGGKLSFAVALLDKSNTGFVMNSMHSREGCYTYIKEIIKGESYIVLADEEKQALDMAMGK